MNWLCGGPVLGIWFIGQRELKNYAPKGYLKIGYITPVNGEL